MRKYYFDELSSRGCTGIFIRDAKVLYAGTVVNNEGWIKELSESELKEYEKYAMECDINFIFMDDIPEVNFYAVPMVEIFAQDSEGGYFCSVGYIGLLESKADICYIDRNGKCFLVADSIKNFLNNPLWKSGMVPYDEVVFYKSREEAGKECDFVEVKNGELIFLNS